VLRDDGLRRWPLAAWRDLAARLLEDGERVLLVGSDADAWVREGFTGLPVADWIGRTSLPELVALLSRCALVVAHDSGPMHLAGLAGAPVLALFGPTNPHEKIVETPRAHVVWGGADLLCRPCYDGREYARCAHNRCLADVGVARVHAATRRMLDAAP
jgi:heptosyltransferase-2